MYHNQNGLMWFQKEQFHSAFGLYLFLLNTVIITDNNSNISKNNKRM